MRPDLLPAGTADRKGHVRTGEKKAAVCGEEPGLGAPQTGPVGQ